jgi:hypothetical protein
MNDPVGNGWCGFPVGISIMVGARIVLALLSIFRGQNHALMMGSSCLMTAGTEALARVWMATICKWRTGYSFLLAWG